MEKVDNTQEHMGKVSREMETLRKNPKEMLEIPNPITDMKNACDRFVSGLDRSEEGFSELKVGQQKLSKMKFKEKKEQKNKQTNKKLPKPQNIQTLQNNVKRYNIHITGIPEEERNI